MQLNDAKEYYESASSSVSGLIEKLNFAGVGTVLVLSGGLSAGGIQITRSLIAALVLFVLSLAFGLMQNLVKTLAWYGFFRSKEELPESTAVDEETLAPQQTPVTLETEVGQAEPDINTATWWFFGLKIVACVAGWGFVIGTFASRMT